MGTINQYILNPYTETFEMKENQSIDKFERRFGWMWRNMKEYESKWEGVFPSYWGASCFLLYEFCGLTKMSVQK